MINILNNYYKIIKLRILNLNFISNRHFIFGATFNINKIGTATRCFGHVSKGNFPSITELKNVVRSYHDSADNIVIVSVCEVKEHEFKIFFSEQD